MSDEANAGLAESEPAGKTLDSILDSAIEKAEGAVKTEAPTEQADKAEDKTDTGDRARDEKGRFAPKDSAAKASEPEQAKAAPAADQKTVTQPAPQSVEAPHTWSADDKAKFATWSPDVQKAVSDRYNAMQADYTRKTQETAEFRRSAEPFLNAIKPFEQYLSQLGPVIGRQPPELIADLLRVEYRLRNGSPQEKAAALANISSQYGIDLAALARGEIQQADPTINNLRQELASLQQWKSQFEQQVQQQQHQQAVQHLESLKIATDESGKLRYPLFEQVRIPVAHALANGEATSYDEAYQKAAAPINALIATELESRAKAADTQRKEALAKADKATPVRSSGSQPGGSAKGKDLDSILSDAIAKHG